MVDSWYSVSGSYGYFSSIHAEEDNNRIMISVPELFLDARQNTLNSHFESSQQPKYC